jgi:Alpha/beta hydrolase domain
MPYEPATLDTTQATLESHDAETDDGVFFGVQQIPSTDWAWASCSAANPFPGTPNSRQICLKSGFDPTKLYQIRFIAKDPYVLGIGFAAFRDMASFFRYQSQDDFGTPSPLAGGVSWVISRGISQSGNFLRQFVHLGMNQDEAGRLVHDGTEPHVAGRRLVMNVRFATPDQILSLYNGGSEGPVWYTHWPDPLRGLPTAGILDRCTANNTCPKLVEYNGATEFWGLHYSPDLVGVGVDQDIPLTRSVRRYYIPSTPHNGGAGGFNVAGGGVPNGPPTAWGACTFRGNQMPYTETVNALTMQFRNWVMHGTPMVPSRYPTLTGHNLVDPTKAAMGFPTIPAVTASSNPSAPDGIINTVKDYDFGPRFNATDQIGIHDIEPPIIKTIFPSKVPRVDADGNELGGVPVVLGLAPLGTYLGWNITAGGFFKGHLCSYANGYIPFATTLAERLATGDPRLSLTERYGNHAGYVAAVTVAADNAMAQGFLLQADHDALIAAAQASNVLQ